MLEEVEIEDEIEEIEEVYGTKFFGGAAEKDLYVDDDIESSKDYILQPLDTLFPDSTVYPIAASLNLAISTALNSSTPSSSAPSSPPIHSPSTSWTSPLSGSAGETLDERLREFNNFARDTLRGGYYSGKR
ncbi:hypothetical protein TrRE_jg5292 [Triparma retinervis]|uniref:Uncharacterized protein n=1 Tax=Triparma retinervis TaxID=2557542 RepID=A0A9W6ZRA1_9STRA|nr:hypothetical protein TrRE_jg5292 [Triparma retinervis]